MKLGLNTALIGAALLLVAGCAAPSDRYGQAQDAARGAQTVPSQPGVTVSGTARIGVTRTIN
jgi:starvation-inducible outer membrane lipoprotein